MTPSKKLAKQLGNLPAQLFNRAEMNMDSQFIAELGNATKLDAKTTQSTNPALSSAPYIPTAAIFTIRPKRKKSWYTPDVVSRIVNIGAVLPKDAADQLVEDTNQELLDLFPPEEYTLSQLLTRGDNEQGGRG